MTIDTKKYIVEKEEEEEETFANFNNFALSFIIIHRFITQDRYSYIFPKNRVQLNRAETDLTSMTEQIVALKIERATVLLDSLVFQSHGQLPSPLPSRYFNASSTLAIKISSPQK